MSPEKNSGMPKRTERQGVDTYWKDTRSGRALNESEQRGWTVWLRDDMLSSKYTSKQDDSLLFGVATAFW